MEVGSIGDGRPVRTSAILSAMTVASVPKALASRAIALDTLEVDSVMESFDEEEEAGVKEEENPGVESLTLPTGVGT